MLLQTLTGNPNYPNVNVKKPTQRLLIRLTINGSTLADAITKLTNFVAGTAYFVDIYIQGPKGQQKICSNKTPLYWLMEICHGKNGFIRAITPTTGSSGAPTTFIITGYIDLSHDGNIQFSSEDYLIVNIYSANTADSIDIYTLTTEDDAKTYISYDYNVTGSGSSPTKLNTASYETLYLAKLFGTGIFDKVQLNFTNGATDELVDVELTADNDSMNDIVRMDTYDVANNYNYLVLGSDVLWQVPLTDLAGTKIINTVEIYTNGNNNYNYVLVRQKNLL